MPQPPSVPIEVVLGILEHLQPSDQLLVLQAFASLAALMACRHLSMDEHSNTILHILARTDDSVADITKHLLPHVKDQIDRFNQQCETALMCAAAGGADSQVVGREQCRFKNGHEGAVRILLDQPGVNVNPHYKWRSTPLLCAIQKGYHTIAKLLLAHKDIRPDLWDECSRNALFWACWNGLEELFEILISHETTLGAEADPMNNEGRTPLSYAAWNCEAEIVELLLAREDVKSDSVAEWGRTSLSYATEGDSLEILRLLLAHGSRPDSVDLCERTPISYAEETGDEETLALLTS
ncbi:ankyrin repeat domain-containing protein 50 [Aspergillus pseudoviridinutans]|uniref:Ankyrin repeat domain-containing protein 50 n=1 Tax=Aspergillus pseudoviridinutans TaxID=1517512 RepID=A0A9P3EWU9_9EURO|nr:ankyrin repeat domain-containing protein 50 [Aspergillus pseudoviridinutans]GIJ88180.1 ankyrin repeat domain-containing protein 50 [Aspergillus pseudoviridinutans]